MDYVYPSNQEILDSNHDQEESLLGQFPLPFFDEISTREIVQINDHLSNDRWNEKKRLRKKRSAGKKDRHSKIHTAQGLRDRRMRLSLHIARKFFGLQDMLGFDKASKTIEWLFSKSKKAIEEVTQLHNSQNPTQTAIKDCQSPTKSDVLASRESRDKARARARERTREKMVINNLDNSKKINEANPNCDQQELGFSVNPNNQYSGTHHLGGTTAASSSAYFSGFGYNKNFANPPAGWLNSSNTFLGFLEGWDSDNFRMESEYYGILPTASTTGDIQEQRLTSVIIPQTDLLDFQSQHQRY